MIRKLYCVDNNIEESETITNGILNHIKKSIIKKGFCFYDCTSQSIIYYDTNLVQFNMNWYVEKMIKQDNERK